MLMSRRPGKSIAGIVGLVIIGLGAVVALGALFGTTENAWIPQESLLVAAAVIALFGILVCVLAAIRGGTGDDSDGPGDDARGAGNGGTPGGGSRG
ncbi:hypothetical protein D9V30_12535 [Mycetocola reblochoni]|uniref:Uncharacterized protein n=3 Tax=Mycetocola reblochoni TaxID=331618 RepID=A0A1R4IJM3_9MICO|nr:hypothetical protein D9V30_12535 [Mycetocola reblochoni]SJN20007.1 hypothetical protein FM119_02130 [Mycetocola reblochoni REB411]